MNERDRAVLLAVARDAIVAHVSGRPRPDVHAEGELARPAAAFVTLHRTGVLRGCIGHLQADRAVAAVVAQCAVAAASEDPRFPAVTIDEVPVLHIELSILGSLEPVVTLDHIVVGRDGLVVEHGWRRGLLLPQVATAWKWDARTFVEQTCVKAGLPRDAWPDGAAKLLKFQAEVFS